jgi:hypothetical protein
MKVSKRNVRKALGELGDSVASVKKRLREFDCKGKRERNDACPVAEYLKSRLTDLHPSNLSVNEESTRVYSYYTMIDVPHTPAVQRFIRAFDKGKYPEFEADFEWP